MEENKAIRQHIEGAEERRKAANDRACAFEALKGIERDKQYSTIKLRGIDGRGDIANAPFVRELVYGTLRWQLYLDWLAGRYTSRPGRALALNDRILLRMGLYQLLYMDSVPDYAAVSSTVSMAKARSRGHEGFVNAVLRAALADIKGAAGALPLPTAEEGEERRLSITHSFAPWIVSEWVQAYGAQAAEALMASLNEPPKLYIRVNPLMTDAAALAGRLRKRGFEIDEDGSDPAFPCLMSVRGERLTDTDEYRGGMFSIQDKSAQVAARALGARPGDLVVDVCAAPGGKAHAAAEAMGNKGRIVAIELNKARTSAIRGGAERLGIKIIEARTGDARDVDEALAGKADKVLADVPCSGLGTARHKPEVKYKELDEKLAALPATQLGILRAASRYTKPGGTLVYSTCTLRESENECVVRAFLAGSDEFELANERTIFPSVDIGDGFYICSMRRKKGARDEELA